MIFLSYAYCVWRHESSSISWSVCSPLVTSTSVLHAHQQTCQEASQMSLFSGRRSQTQPHQNTTTSSSPGQEAFCCQWKTQLSPVILSVYVMVIWGLGAVHTLADIQTVRSFSLATFVLHSSLPLVCIATLRLVGLGAKWLIGKPREAANTDSSSGPPVALKLAKLTFSSQEQQFSTTQVWKRL